MQTPVVFIIFNRPDYAEKVFAEIARARPPKLLVIGDGPRSDEEGARCRAARAIINRVDWDCDVLTNYSDTNLGCRKRVASGLEWAFSVVEEAIILEDDCVPHPSFFPFCEQLLDRYREDSRVMMITGSNFLGDKLDIEQTYTFSRFFHIWGWATWRRAWKLYDPELCHWSEYKKQHQLEGLYAVERVQNHYREVFDMVPVLNSWATPWVYTCIFNNGLCIVPRVNLISNVGVQGAHSQTAQEQNNLPVFPIETDPIVHPFQVFADFRFDDPCFRLNNVYNPQPKPPLWYRLSRPVWHALKRMLGKKAKP